MALLGRGGWFTLTRLTNTLWYGSGAGDEVALDSFFGPSGAPGAYTLTAEAGAFALTGQTATLVKVAHYTLATTTGAFALTGFAAALSAANAEVMLAAKGTLTLTGVDATLRIVHAYKLAAVKGTFALTGIAAIPRRACVLIAASRAFTLTGIAANLVVFVAKRLLAETGALLLVGKNVNLVYAALVHYTITPLPGRFVMTGKDAHLYMPLTRQPGRLRFGRPVPVTWRL